MSLRTLQPGLHPLGQFDCDDTFAPKGGEVVCLKSVALTADDLAAADAYDGYVLDGGVPSRTFVALATAATDAPLGLSDDGIAGYGTLLGSVVGSVAGANSSAVVVGPSTAAGSGKCTMWTAPGLYSVSLDCVAADLQPSVTTLSAGDPIYFSATGQLTADNTIGVQVGHFVQFDNNGSLVSTPAKAVNPPETPRTFKFVTLFWNPVYA